MKHYLLFAGNYLYPNGGWDDFRDSFNTYKECIDWIAESKFEWHQIVDSITGDRCN